jgi:hypothetical protein
MIDDEPSMYYVHYAVHSATVHKNNTTIASDQLSDAMLERIINLISRVAIKSGNIDNI